MNKPAINVVYFSDVLCVWAYITQIRVDELQSSFPHEVDVEYRFLQVFGDVRGKMLSQWADRDGLKGYAAHVQEVAAQYEHIAISPRTWVANTPTSSLPAHLLLCGVKALHAADPAGVAPGLVGQLLDALRHAFFVEAIDISRQQALLDVAGQAGVDLKALQPIMDSGAAHAQLAADLALATQSTVRSSPTLVFNEGRQILSGNVGYRILEANVRELLRSPGEQQSWC